MFFLGVCLGIIGSLLTLVGVPINSTMGTIFLIFSANPFVALGYWSTSQGLSICTTIGELYYTTDKDIDDTSCVQAERMNGNINLILGDLYHFDLFFTILLIVFLLVLGINSFIFSEYTEALKFGITALSIILGLIILYKTIMQLAYEYEALERIVYVLTIIGVFILFKSLLAFNIGVFNIIPLLLGISFMEFPSLYIGNSNKKVRTYKQMDDLHSVSNMDWIDYVYLFEVFVCNLGIGSSKLINYLEIEDHNNTEQKVMNLYAGKIIAAFTSSFLWLLLGSTRSALEESVSTVEMYNLFNSLPIIICTIIFFKYISSSYREVLVDIANSPLENLPRTICSICILTVLIMLSAYGSFNIFFIMLFVLLAIGFNVLVNYINIPNSALSFITYAVPFTGLVF